jgi:hypothetical protein
VACPTVVPWASSPSGAPNLRIEPDQPVATEVIEDLCTAATWAPNHKLTQPWRFAVLPGPLSVRLLPRRCPNEEPPTSQAATPTQCVTVTE